jgi:hypothetical protein
MRHAETSAHYERSMLRPRIQRNPYPPSRWGSQVPRPRPESANLLDPLAKPLTRFHLELTIYIGSDHFHHTPQGL